MILCAHSTWRSREQDTKRRSSSGITYSITQNNNILWLPNMADIFLKKFTRCAKVCGLLFLDYWLQAISAQMAVMTVNIQFNCNCLFLILILQNFNWRWLFLISPSMTHYKTTHHNSSLLWLMKFWNRFVLSFTETLFSYK